MAPSNYPLFPFTQCQLNCSQALIIWLHSVLPLWGQFPCLSSANNHLSHLPAPRFFCGPQKVPFLPNSQIIHPSSQCTKCLRHSVVCKRLIQPPSCDELCRCEYYGQIYYSLFHRVHIWWEGIWEMYECCNLLLATTKPVKLIKCGLLDVYTCLPAIFTQIRFACVTLFHKCIYRVQTLVPKGSMMSKWFRHMLVVCVTDSVIKLWSRLNQPDWLGCPSAPSSTFDF